ncbi:MAG: prolyl oligopeptidase family serine peptidase [Opitutaceae bacterium]
MLVLFGPAFADPIAVETLFKESKADNFTLSPDGRYIALIAENPEHRRALYARDLDNGETHSWTLKGGNAYVNSYFWTSNEWLYFTSARPSRGMVDSFVARRDSDKFRVTDFEGRTNLMVDALIDREPILVLRPSEVESSLVEIHSETGVQLKTVATYRGYVRGATTDLNGNPRILRLGEERLEERLIHRAADSESWEPLGLPIDASLLGFGPDGTTLLVSDYFGRDRSALYRYNLAAKELSDPLFEDPVHDLHSTARLILDVSRKRPLGIRYEADRLTTIWFSPEIQQVQQILNDRYPETINSILGIDLTQGRFLFSSYSDRQPLIYRLLDYAQKKISDLWPTRPQIDPALMASTEVITFSSRDGLSLRGYLTTPREGQGPFPTVALVHGGPWLRDTWGFKPEAQFLASRGYAVLQINYRGSAGFGRKISYQHRGDLKGMNDDIEDGVRWAIKHGYTDPDRVGIMGGSFGGYAALYGVAFKPELYKCAISEVGISDWPEHIDSLKKDREYVYQLMIEYFGPDYRQTLAPLSPINQVDAITAPVFIAFGRQDSNVSPSQSKQMIQELTRRGHPPIVFARHWEGHGFFDEKIQSDYYRAVETFLAENL